MSLGDLDMAGGCLSSKNLRELYFRVLREVVNVRASNLGHISGAWSATVSVSSGCVYVTMADTKVWLARDSL